MSSTVSCDKARTERKMEEDISQVWKHIYVSGWSAEKEGNTYSVNVGTEKIDEDFTLRSADILLKTLSWPKSCRVLGSQRPRYTYIFPLLTRDFKHNYIYCLIRYALVYALIKHTNYKCCL